MELQKAKLNSKSERYFSSIHERLKAIGDSLGSTISRYADENHYVQIGINGKQSIQSLEIAGLLLDTPDKVDVRKILLRNINAALQQRGRANLEEFMRVVSPREYMEIIVHEQEKIKNSISAAERDLGLFTANLTAVNRKAVSKSGNVEMTMSGANIIGSINIPDAFLCATNKAQIELDLIETTNALTGQIQELMAGKLLAGGDKIRQEIQIG